MDRLVHAAGHRCRPCGRRHDAGQVSLRCRSHELLPEPVGHVVLCGRSRGAQRAQQAGQQQNSASTVVNKVLPWEMYYITFQAYKVVLKRMNHWAAAFLAVMCYI